MRSSLAIVLCSFGCVAPATLVSAPGHFVDSPYAPRNNAPTTEGLVEYSLGPGPMYIPSPKLVDERRQAAYLEMHNACGGAYEIVSEGDRMELGFVGGPAYATSVSTSVRQIRFRCVGRAGASSVLPPAYDDD